MWKPQAVSWLNICSDSSCPRDNINQHCLYAWCVFAARDSALSMVSTRKRLTAAAAAAAAYKRHMHSGVRHRPAGPGPELAHAGAVPAERPAVLQR
jgi:hypothetical protein